MPAKAITSGDAPDSEAASSAALSSPSLTAVSTAAIATSSESFNEPPAAAAAAAAAHLLLLTTAISDKIVALNNIVRCFIGLNKYEKSLKYHNEANCLG
jgi:hypothetical protein